MFTAWIIFHVIICVSLVLVVLMQSSKGEGLDGSAFGGGGSMGGAVFGGRGAASFLSRATTVLAVVFMLNCASLAYMSANQDRAASNPALGESVVSREAQKERDQALQLQQQQIQDTTSASPFDIQILPNEAADTNSADESTDGSN